MQQELTYRTRQRYEMVDLTADVARVVAAANLEEGLCSVYVPHATAAIVINENDDPNLCAGAPRAPERLVPEGVWQPDRADRKGAAIIKPPILGPGEPFPVPAGPL